MLLTEVDPNLVTDNVGSPAGFERLSHNEARTVGLAKFMYWDGSISPKKRLSSKHIMKVFEKEIHIAKKISSSFQQEEVFKVVTTSHC